MFYLAKGLSIAPREVLDMEHAEFMEWINQMIDYNDLVRREQDKALAEVKNR